MKKIRAIYGNGIFRPEERVDLPDGTAVELEYHPVLIPIQPVDPLKKLSAINAILAEQNRPASAQPTVRRIEGS